MGKTWRGKDRRRGGWGGKRSGMVFWDADWRHSAAALGLVGKWRRQGTGQRVQSRRGQTDRSGVAPRRTGAWSNDLPPDLIDHLVDDLVDDVVGVAADVASARSGWVIVGFGFWIRILGAACAGSRVAGEQRRETVRDAGQVVGRRSG